MNTNTYIIKLWFKHTVPGYGVVPAATLGPFTKHSAQKVVKHLTCSYEVQLIGTKVPDWAVK